AGLGRSHRHVSAVLATRIAQRTSTIRNSVFAEVPAPARFPVRRVSNQLCGFALHTEHDAVSALHGGTLDWTGLFERTHHASVRSRPGWLFSHGHSTHVSIARMAGIAHGKQAAEANDRHAPHDDRGAHLSDSESAELLPVSRYARYSNRKSHSGGDQQAGSP